MREPQHAPGEFPRIAQRRVYLRECIAHRRAAHNRPRRDAPQGQCRGEVALDREILIEWGDHGMLREGHQGAHSPGTGAQVSAKHLGLPAKAAGPPGEGQQGEGFAGRVPAAQHQGIARRHVHAQPRRPGTGAGQAQPAQGQRGSGLLALPPPPVVIWVKEFRERGIHLVHNSPVSESGGAPESTPIRVVRQ